MYRGILDNDGWANFGGGVLLCRVENPLRAVGTGIEERWLCVRCQSMSTDRWEKKNKTNRWPTTIERFVRGPNRPVFVIAINNSNDNNNNNRRLVVCGRRRADRRRRQRRRRRRRRRPADKETDVHAGARSHTHTHKHGGQTHARTRRRHTRSMGTHTTHAPRSGSSSSCNSTIVVLILPPSGAIGGVCAHGGCGGGGHTRPIPKIIIINGEKSTAVSEGEETRPPTHRRHSSASDNTRWSIFGLYRHSHGIEKGRRGDVGGLSGRAIGEVLFYIFVTVHRQFTIFRV